MIRQAAIALVVVTLRTVATGQVFSFQPSNAIPEFESRMSRAGVPRNGNPAAYADPSIDVTYYRLNLRVVPATSFLGGSVLMQARCVSDSVTRIGLDLVNTMHVDSVLAGGHAVPFQQFQLVLIVSLDRVYRKQEMVSVEVFYGGYPAATGLGSIEFSEHGGTPWVWSLSEPYGARDWWPCKDHPADKADSVDVFVTADAGMKVGSNGRLVAVIDNTDGTKTTHWAERYPIATYLVSIAVTNFAEFTNWFRYSPTDSMPVINYVLPEHLADAQANLPKVIGMLSIFSERYGLYPFVAEKYGHSEFGFGGAMEHQTMTSTTSFDETVIAHELAHQWFGDLITCASWQHLWLNEGFASYNEAVYGEAMYGPSAYWSSISARMDLALKATGSLFVEDTSDARLLFDNHLVYSKGASVLHMLRHILGDSVFFASMKAYAEDPSLRYGVATTEDFQQVCESVSGVNLGYFFREWVYGNGHPRYSVRWTTASVPPGYQVTVAIDQTTSGTDPVFFSMPVDLELRSATFDTTVRVFHSANGEQFTFLLLQRPDTVLIDPGHWILRELVSPSTPLPAAYQLEQNYPNPFNGTTSIVYSLSHRGSYSLKIYDLLGRDVITLTDTRGDPGFWTATWDGRDRAGNGVASGIYLYRLAGEGVALTRKMVLIR